MAVTRREYIFGAVIISAICVVMVAFSIATDSWIVSDADIIAPITFGQSRLNYGLFAGEQVLWQVATANANPLHMTCVFEVGACAMSCKTTVEARRDEVLALANGHTPSLPCAAVTTIDESQPLRSPAVISSTLYIILLIVLILHLLSAITALSLALLNSTKNPTEPLFGVPGIRYSNLVCSAFGLCALMLWGIYWATSGLRDHLAMAYVVLGELIPVGPSLGFSYWLILGSTICALVNVALVEIRRWMLERDPDPPTISIDNHSDGTIFLY